MWGGLEGEINNVTLPGIETGILDCQSIG